MPEQSLIVLTRIGLLGEQRVTGHHSSWQRTGWARFLGAPSTRSNPISKLLSRQRMRQPCSLGPRLAGKPVNLNAIKRAQLNGHDP
jgi:hypothetical protein